jgi:hypothetical protein
MDTALKACPDCRHYVPAVRGWVLPEIARAHCCHPASIDLTGGRISLGDMRYGATSHLQRGGKCGIDGKLFEPKEA